MPRSRAGRPLVGVMRPANLLTVLLLFLLSGVATAQDSKDPLSQAKGHQPLHGYFSQLPWEKVDMLTGSLVLTFTDLVLPGYSGMDLRVGRVFNAGGEAPGAGWSRMFVEGPSAVSLSTPTNPNPTIESWDGATEFTYQAGIGSPVYMTLGFGRLHKPANSDEVPVLEQPDGTIVTFGRQVNSQNYAITRRADQYGNAIDYQYGTDGALAAVTQYLGSRSRTVTFDSQGVHYDGKTWAYVRASSNSLFTDITPPTGPGWHFDYDFTTPSAEGMTMTVTTPEGGTVTYVMDMRDGPYGPYPPHAPLYRRLVVISRSVGGHNITPGTWTFRYPTGFGTQGSDCRVTRPDGTTVDYLHARQVNGDHFTVRNSLWRVTVKDNSGNVRELSTYNWDGDIVPGWRDLSLPDGEGGSYVEPARPLLIRSSSVERDGHTFSQAYEYCGDLDGDNCQAPYDGGYPRRVTENGDFFRETTVAYRHFSSPYVLGKPTTVTVSDGVQSFSSTYGYQDATAFLCSKSEYGVVTTYTPNSSLGTIASMTDANNYSESYEYDWGVRAITRTPKYIETRVINADGTVQSRTRTAQSGQPTDGSGAVERWEYDLLGRVRYAYPRTYPAGGVTRTEYLYDDAGGGARVDVRLKETLDLRYLDGFGRVTRTSDNVGVTRFTEYDAQGRVTKQSLPVYFGSTVDPRFPRWT